jgi:hypothetical protein
MNRFLFLFLLMASLCFSVLEVQAQCQFDVDVKHSVDSRGDEYSITLDISQQKLQEIAHVVLIDESRGPVKVIKPTADHLISFQNLKPGEYYVFFYAKNGCKTFYLKDEKIKVQSSESNKY